MEIDNDFAAKIMAHRLGREPTEEEIAENRKLQEEAIGLSSGVLGTVGGGIPKFGKIRQMLGGAEAVAPAEIGLADKIKQAVANSPVKQMTGDVKSTLRNVSFKPEAEKQIGKVIQDIPEEVAPIMSEDKRLKLLQMIRQDKNLLGKVK